MSTTDELLPKCDGVACLTVAKWSIANIFDSPALASPLCACFQSITAAFACGVHLNQVLRTMRWEMDAVEIRAVVGESS